MANIPTITQLYAAIIADVEQELNISLPLFGRNYLRAQAMVLAGRIWLMYLLLGKIQKNIFVDTADPVASGGTLERFGFVKLGRYPFPATQGQYTVSVTGTASAVIPAQTTFKSNDDALSPSKLYVLDADYTLTGSGDTIVLRALEAGDGSKLSLGNQLTATAPIPLVNSVVTVTSETVEPQPAEDIEAYRQKAIDAYRLEPQGGAPADYRLWASEVQGIVQSYPYVATGQTSRVNLYIEADNANGVPTPTDLQNVEDAIELPTSDRPARKPTTVKVNYLAITPKFIDIEIADFSDLTGDIETAIYETIQDELSRVRPFIGAIDVLSEKNDYFDINKIIQLILTANPGSVFGAVTMTVDDVPMTSFTFTNGDIPILDEITYV